MEQQRPLPPGTLDADDLADVLSVASPCLTVRMSFDRDEPDAQHRAEVAWQSLAETALEQGADRAAVEAAADVVRPLSADVDAAVILCDSHGVRAVAPSGGDWPSDGVRWQALPWFAPIVDSRQRVLDHVLVVCDRSGAELTLVRDGAALRTVEVGGRTDPIRKVAAGGWSQRRIQERAERVWRLNAADVADAIAELVRDNRVEVVLLGGEERALALVHEALPDEARDRVAPVDVTRAVDGDGALEEVSITRALADAVARQTVEWLHLVRDRVPTGDAVTSLDDVVACMRQSQVAALLIGEAGEAEPRLQYVPERPDLLALLGEELPVAAGSVPVAAADALAWAALQTGAGVRAVPQHALQGPASAVLRWSQPAD